MEKRVKFPPSLPGILLAVFFLVAIWLPLADSLFELDPAPAPSEFRRMAPQPRLKPDYRSVTTYSKKFQHYYDDSFGWRNSMIHWHSLAKIHLFGISPLPRVLVGKEGWLFLGDAPVVDYHRAFKPFSARQLSSWRMMLEQRRDWLAGRGIRFLLVAVPDKHTIYPEYLPDWLDRVGETPRLDQLMEYLRAGSGIEVLDLRPALRRAKGAGRAYHRTDTHWNGLGAYYAYRAIMERLGEWFPNVSPLPRSAFLQVVEQGQGGDLARMLDLTGHFSEELIELRPLEPPRAHPANQGLPSAAEAGIRRPRAMERAGEEPTLPRAVMLHDSFGLALIPLLSEHFERILFLWEKKFSASRIAGEEPHIVIMQISGRALMRPPPANDFSLENIGVERPPPR